MLVHNVLWDIFVRSCWSLLTLIPQEPIYCAYNVDVACRVEGFHVVNICGPEPPHGAALTWCQWQQIDHVSTVAAHVCRQPPPPPPTWNFRSLRSFSVGFAFCQQRCVGPLALPLLPPPVS